MNHSCLYATLLLLSAAPRHVLACVAFIYPFMPGMPGLLPSPACASTLKHPASPPPCIAQELGSVREVLLVLVHRSEQLQRHRQQLFKAAQSQARQKHTACTAQQQQQQRAAISGVLKQQRDLLVLLDHIITLTHQVRGDKGMTWEGPRACRGGFRDMAGREQGHGGQELLPGNMQLQC